MKLSGFADEAAEDVATQIATHQKLGWDYLDLRLIDGLFLTDLSASFFDAVRATLAASGMRVSSIGSSIGNRNGSIGEPFSRSTETFALALERMRALGTRHIRIMTYVNDGRSEDAWGREALCRVKELARMAEAEDVVLCVENCAGWAGLSPVNYRALFETVASPALKAVFDTGNPASKGLPEPAWEWYEAVKPFIAHVHVKAHTGKGSPDARHTWPDAGASDVAAILNDLKASGFDGFISIEPHLINPAKPDAQAIYLEYGERLKKML